MSNSYLYDTLLKITSFGQKDDNPIMTITQMKTLIISPKQNHLEAYNDTVNYLHTHLNLRPKRDKTYFINLGLDKIDNINVFETNDLDNFIPIESIQQDLYNLIINLNNEINMHNIHKWTQPKNPYSINYNLNN